VPADDYLCVIETNNMVRGPILVLASWGRVASTMPPTRGRTPDVSAVQGLLNLGIPPGSLFLPLDRQVLKHSSPLYPSSPQLPGLDPPPQPSILYQQPSHHQHIMACHLLFAFLVWSQILSATAAPEKLFPVPQGALDFAERVRNGNIPKIDITPGPGFPSVESLGAASARDLIISSAAKAKAANSVEARGLDADVTRNNSHLVKRQSTCYWDISWARSDTAWGCYWYLYNLGTTACVVPYGRSIQMVEVSVYGGGGPGIRHVGRVQGQGVCGGSASSYCRDVATAVNSIMAWCQQCRTWNAGSFGTENTCAAQGSEYAYGNGCLWVYLWGDQYNN